MHRPTLCLRRPLPPAPPVACLVAAVSLLASTACGRMQPAAWPPPVVWVASESLKVQPDTPERPSVQFDARNGKVRLYSARGEYVAFQVVFRAGAEPLRKLALRMTPLTAAAPATGSTAPPALGAENVDCFAPHMLRVEVPSQDSGDERVPGAAPGEYPVQLVPLRRGAAAEGRSEYEAPGEVAPRRNATVWVDLWVPEEQAPGVYRGELEVLADGKPLRRLATELNVWRFTLPRETHCKTFCEASTNDLRWAFGFKEIDDPAFRALEDRFFQMAHQHRLNFNLSSGRSAVWDMTQRYRKYLDGSAFRARAGRGAGMNLWMVGFTNEGVNGDDEASVTAFVKKVAALHKQHDWPAEIICYLLDEPQEEEEFQQASQRGLWVKAATGKALPTYLTTPEWGKVEEGAVDIWGELKADDIAGRQEAGQRAWAVNADYATGPYVDTPGTAGRALIWMSWRLDLHAWHFWNVCYWVDRQNLLDADGKRLPVKVIDQDPQRYLTDTWNDPMTFDMDRRNDPKKRDQIRINGDAVLFYPGTPAGIQGPLASFALKSLRRGLQDYEYLWLLEQRGVDTNSLERRICPEAGVWDPNPDAWDRARLELGEQLDRIAARQPAAAAPPTAAPVPARRPVPGGTHEVGRLSARPSPQLPAAPGR